MTGFRTYGLDEASVLQCKLNAHQGWFLEADENFVSRAYPNVHKAVRLCYLLVWTRVRYLLVWTPTDRRLCVGLTFIGIPLDPL
uniref:Uncharacterized protein n=1 Tax=Romanomermis culicivorax TaxID=13658 RepID=A0A915J1R4_ROMCU